MDYRTFGDTGKEISEIGLGTWQLGGRWGDPFDVNVANKTLKTAVDLGINCFDTADVYKGGLSEQTIGKFIKDMPQPPFVITKSGRRLDPHVAEGYCEENIRAFIENSRKNMQMETLDMVLLHCPPTDVYYKPELFKALDQIKEDGKIKHYGVSVERVEEGLKALDYDGVDAIEIIFNMFRLRPAEYFFKRAKEARVGIIVRVPLASGLLTGKYTRHTAFGEKDHRTFNRDGAAFDKGETFSGVDFELGLKAAEELKKLFDTDDLASYAIRWVLMFEEVSTVIPGASRPEQVQMNASAAQLPPLSKQQMEGVKEIYDRYLKDPVHYAW